MAREKKMLDLSEEWGGIWAELSKEGGSRSSRADICYLPLEI